MNYLEHYYRLVDRARIRNWTKEDAPVYTELHHVVPRSAGGDNSPDNLILLTAEEHFVAHLLLVKIFKGTDLYRKMVYAAHAMSMDIAGRKINNKRFGWVRREYSKSLKGKTFSKETRRKLSAAHTGKVVTEETRQKLRARRFSDETKAKMRESQLGKIHTDEAKEKMKEAWKSRVVTEETKSRMKEAWKVRKAKKGINI